MNKKTMPILGLLCAAHIAAATNDDYVLTMTPTNGYVGQTVTVSYETPCLTSSWFDYIGYYPAGHPAQMTKAWTLYGAPSGSAQFTLAFVGDWVLQYYHSSGVALTPPLPFSVLGGGTAYVLNVSTNTATVGNQIAVSWQTATNVGVTGDTVGYYATTNSSSFIASTVVDWAHDGTVYFTMRHPGNFVFGYFKNGNIGNPAAALQDVTVQSPPVRPVLQKNGPTLMASWFGYQGASYRVLTSTTVTTPLSSWTLSMTLPGTNGVFRIPVNQSAPQRFIAVQEIWQ